jgi:surface protein
MKMMFIDSFTFNQLIGAWDTSKVTNMQVMFYMCPSFNQPLGAWDVSKVTWHPVYPKQIFDGATAMTSANLPRSNFCTGC